jgi:hypothetical protein
MGFPIFGAICICVGAGALVLIAAGLLRLAIYATNRMVAPGQVKAQAGGIPEWDWDDWDNEGAVEDELDRPWRRGPAVPEASTLKCMGIAFLTALTFGLGFVLMGFAAEDLGYQMRRDETKLVVVVFNLPIAWLALSALLAGLLPTRFGRAALVAFIYGLTIIAFFMLIGIVFFGFAVVFR